MTSCIDLVSSDSLDPLEYIVELFLAFIIEAACSPCFDLLGLLVLLDTLASLLVGLEETKALLWHFVVDAVDFAGSGLLMVLKVDA